MHIAPIRIYATIGNNLRSLCSARSLVLCCSLAGVGLTTATAGDGQHSGRKDESRQQQQQQQPARGDWRTQQREDDPRQFEARADEHRRTQQEQAARNSDSPRRNGRLTEDERRDLRRQINEAGQDIYARPPRR